MNRRNCLNDSPENRQRLCRYCAKTSINCNTQFKMRWGSLLWRDHIQFNFSSQHQPSCASLFALTARELGVGFVQCPFQSTPAIRSWFLFHWCGLCVIGTGWDWVGRNLEMYYKQIKDVIKCRNVGIGQIWIQIPVYNVGDLDNHMASYSVGVLIHKRG